jgi:predicted hotdog family 3-hydroxylacyl-ACP dehydratase
MCLLDGVLDWDEVRIACRASSHQDPGNPMRIADRLPAACGIEYAAQAMAVHAALLARGGPLGRGLLASARAVTLRAARLDDAEGPLHISAERLSGEAQHVLYAFRLSCDAGELLSGRAAVLLEASARA